MLLYFGKFRCQISNLMMITGAVLMLAAFTPGLYAQEEDLFGSSEDDSLLFGDEFDLGGDDFSFETDDTTAPDTEATDEDDFFGDFEDDEVTEENEAVSDTTELDEWGLGGDSEDELFGVDSGEASVTEVEYSDHHMDFRKKFQGTMMEGAGVTLSFYSPQYVSDKMDTWYSFMDLSLTVELPWHIDNDPVSISFLIDASSFKFENSFPEGGSFKGISLMPMVRAEAFGLEVEAGLGAYFPSFGVMTGLGYAYQYHSLFFSTGYRWNWAYNIDPIGSGWWAEPRFTIGLKLW